MSFAARVFRVLIASPSDVTEEREIAVRTIQEWNDLNSGERQLVLLPLRWETHSAPEYGRRPQEVINRQVVDHSDLLVGIFWTRIGSPTGAADSGTLEEIERVATQGKPVMLYFSQAKQDPERIEVDQLQKLREFKKKTFPKALVESYSTQIEFRDKLARQLEIQLRTLLAEEGRTASGALGVKPVTDIQVAFADPQTGVNLGPHLDLESTLLEIEELDRVPDLKSDSAPKGLLSEELGGIVSGVQISNKNYYREMVAYLARRTFLRPVRFWMKNVGGVGARDVYVDLRISSEKGELSIFSPSKAQLTSPVKSGGVFSFSSWGGDSEENEPQRRGSEWTTYLELRALQPQREVSPPARVVVGATASGLVTIAARIYADTLPEPLVRTLTINWDVKHASVKAMELLKDYL